MKQSDLDTLLDKYYSGATSAEEEKVIGELLKSDDCPDKYSLEKEMFAAFEEGDNIPEPSIGFESDIMARIDEEESRGKVKSLKRRLYSVVAVAASLLIIVSSYIVLLQNRGPADTFTDPQLAYIQVLETLKMVSDELSTGKEEMAHLAMIDRASENIEMLGSLSNEAKKQLEPLGHFNRSINILERTSLNKNDNN